ncbi:hypothetical protein BEN47_06925 [Hymenobacter lapidarius]|uniref:TonB C-terminal domain-containing protein n=1 Tax=Hymenobacter lapidarius TaxID=1908237 RepID=A0A1G1TFE8_9BACT|nr:TonB family protein [Hymenobacter lapidarius]OGX89606.1 hypothetical protein BEN47_06925 [Hymenobacter lapidarius]
MLPVDLPFALLPAPGPHPATAELRAYAAGTLAPADEHRIEAHSLDCERCAELVAGFSMSDAATTDHAVAELRTRLQTRVGQPDAAPVAPARTWPRLAAAAALVGVVAAGLWGLDQRKADAPTVAAVRQEAMQQAAPAPLPEPLAPAAAPAATAAAPAETIAAIQAAKTETETAFYAAVTTPPARRTEPAARAIRHSTRPSDTAASATNEVALAGVPQADKAVAAAEMKEVAAVVYEASANDEAGEVLVSPAAPNAKKMLRRQVAIADSAQAQNTANQQAVSKAKARLMAVATPALSGAMAGRTAATSMPAPASINPAPVGGMGDLREYIRKTAVEFEPEARAMRLTGLVHVKFTVGADGKLSDFKVSRGLRDDYDAEAIRIISEGPAWQPGVAGGRRAPLPMEVTVPF